MSGRPQRERKASKRVLENDEANELEKRQNEEEDNALPKRTYNKKPKIFEPLCSDCKKVLSADKAEDFACSEEGCKLLTCDGCLVVCENDDCGKQFCIKHAKTNLNRKTAMCVEHE